MRPNRSDNQKENISRDCLNTQARLLAYLDNELDVVTQVQMQAHLDACERCRTELAQHRRAESALASAAFVAPPVGDLRPDFYARLAESNASKAKQRGTNIWRVVVPACAAGLVWLVWRPVLPTNQADKSKAAKAAGFGRIEKLVEKPEQLGRIVPNRLPRTEKLDVVREKASDALPANKKPAPVQNFALFQPVQPKSQLIPPQKPIIVADLPAAASSKRAYFLPSSGQREAKLSTVSPERTYHRDLSDMTLALKATLDSAASAAVTGKPLSPESFGYRTNLSSHFAAHGDLTEDNRQIAKGVLQTGRLAGESPEGAWEIPDDNLNEKVPETVFYKQIGSTKAALAASLPSVQLVGKAAAVSSVQADKVDLEVRDDVRGFASSTRVAGSVEQQESGEVLTIEAESENGS